MLTAEECKEFSDNAKKVTKQEQDKWLDELWEKWLPKVKQVLGTINYSIEEGIKFACRHGKKYIITRIIDIISFHIGISCLNGYLCDRIISYIVSSIYNKYTSAGFVVEINDDTETIKISWD